MNTKRPYVICHMSPSIDGKIVASNWPSIRIAYAEYELRGNLVWLRYKVP